MLTEMFAVILVAFVILAVPAIVFGVRALRSNEQLWDEIQVMAANPHPTRNKQ